MKKLITSALLLASVVTQVFVTVVHAQTTPAKQPRYKDVVAENPNAEADMKVVGDFVNALTNADLDKAKSLLSEKYKGYGPSMLDSSTAEQTLTGWKENYKNANEPESKFCNANI